jgi:flagellar biogenesis protein FliO
MQRTATMRSIAGSFALLWLLGCMDSLAAQGVAMPNSPAALAPAGSADSPRPGWDDVAGRLPSTSASAARSSQAGNSLNGSTSRSARESPVPLTRSAHEEGGRTAAGRRADSAQSLVAIAGSLAAVLGAFFLLAWLLRRAAPQAPGALPDEAFEVLGRAPLANRQQVQLLRCGRKLLLVSVTPSGAETLTEINDAAEVDRLATACRESQSHGATAAFHRVLEQWTTRRASQERLSGDPLSDRDLSRSVAAGCSDERERGGNV